ncbi:MAG: hypothetical protein ABSB35_09630 [Bryobacteraceae bacterium]
MGVNENLDLVRVPSGNCSRNRIHFIRTTHSRAGRDRNSDSGSGGAGGHLSPQLNNRQAHDRKRCGHGRIAGHVRCVRTGDFAGTGAGRSSPRPAERQAVGGPATAALHTAEIRKLHRAGVRKSEIARRLEIGRTSIRRILTQKKS